MDEEVRWRVPVIALGLAALAFGALQLLTGGVATDLLSSVPWIVGSLVVHDAVVGPLALGAGAVLLRVLPGRGEGGTAGVRRVVGAGLLVAVALLVVALPAIGTPGVADNPSTTPRDYPRGLLVLLAVDAVATAVVAGLVLARSRRAGDAELSRGGAAG